MNTLQKHTERIHQYAVGLFALTLSHSAYAQLTEVEGVGNFVLGIFSPALLLVLLTIMLIGCGLAVYFGRMTGALFGKIIVGSIFVFGAGTIAPKLIAIIA